MREPDYTDPMRYESSEAAAFRLMAALRGQTQLEEQYRRRRQRDYLLVGLATLFLLGQLVRVVV